MTASDPRKLKVLPSYERVRELFKYDPDNGLLTKGGRVMGWGRNQNHYLKVDIDGGKYLLHRVAIVLMTGRWPLAHVDHRDLDIFNNRWANLRECSKTDNQGNRTKRADNTSGFKGVSWDEDRQLWRAQICKHGKRFYIGRFSTREQAHAAFFIKAQELFGEFARAA